MLLIECGRDGLDRHVWLDRTVDARAVKNEHDHEPRLRLRHSRPGNLRSRFEHVEDEDANEMPATLDVRGQHEGLRTDVDDEISVTTDMYSIICFNRGIAT